MKLLICEITGQHGGYLAKLLLRRGYELGGTSRDEMAHIGLSRRKTFQAGNVDIWCDWGQSPAYAAAMWRMLQQGKVKTFITTLDLTESVEYFVSCAFVFFSLKWLNHVKVEETLFRPSDICARHADPAKASYILGWLAQPDADGVIGKTCETTDAMDRWVRK